MRAVGLDDSLLISHVVKQKVLEFKTGQSLMSEVIWKIFMKRFPVGVGHEVAAELVVMNIYCFLFVFSLFMCNNEYITHYF